MKKSWLRESFNVAVAVPLMFASTHEFMQLVHGDDFLQHCGYIQNHISTGLGAYFFAVFGKYLNNILPLQDFLKKP